jgi:hypothetical protein
MPQDSWSARRERQYGHIKESLIERGKPEWLAEEIADLEVDEKPAQHDESVTVSSLSIQ